MIFIDGLLPTITTFPNNETMIKVPKRALEGRRVLVEWLFEGDQEIMQIRQLHSLLKGHDVYCAIPYLPYERMDRIEEKNPFSLDELVSILPSDWKYIVIEPHSAKSSELFEEHGLELNVKFFNSFRSRNNTVHVLPDKGSVARYLDKKSDTKQTIITGLKSGEVYLVGRKTRDFGTGNITKYVVDQQLYYDAKNDSVVVNQWNKSDVHFKLASENGWATFCVHDDVVSYGNTFVNLAKYLGSEFEDVDPQFILEVAHAEPSIFKGDLLEYFTKISTTNSLLRGTVFSSFGYSDINVSDVRDVYRGFI